MKDRKRVQVCVPVCEPFVEAMKQTATRAAQIGDVIEFRLDCLEEKELNQQIPRFEQWLSTLNTTTILTLRPAEQGGHQSFDLQRRRSFFKGIGSESLLDIELDLVQDLSSSEHELDWDRVICSHHDFTGLPVNLDELYARMAATPARILKVAIQANDITDCLPIFGLLNRAQDEGREMISIAMGPAGVATRILGPAWGAFLTYGAVEQRKETAQGQVLADQLRVLFNIDNIDRDTMIAGLVGLPVTHSFSPHIHNAAFASLGFNGVYIPFEVRNIGAFIRRMVHPATRELDWNIRGLSVTAPHKSTVMDLLDSLAPEAREIGAVNTVVVEQTGLRGYNTDAAALRQALNEKLGNLGGANCAVLGAGGAARAALWVLRSAGAQATVFARDGAKAREVADKFGAACNSLDGSRFADFDVVINTTPVGTRGPLEVETPAVAEQLRGARLAYDLVYNPSETRFLYEASQAGCDTLGGLSLLINQAFEQFRLWTCTEAPRHAMVRAAQAAINNA